MPSAIVSGFIVASLEARRRFRFFTTFLFVCVAGLIAAIPLFAISFTASYGNPFLVANLRYTLFKISTCVLATVIIWLSLRLWSFSLKLEKAGQARDQ
jgi:hypothetical protein